jgi:hypothetical protein
MKRRPKQLKPGCSAATCGTAEVVPSRIIASQNVAEKTRKRFIAQKTCDGAEFLTPQTLFGMTE